MMSAFQDACHFTNNTRHRYEALAQKCNLVGAIAHGMGYSPGIGIRGGSLPTGHPLAHEWTVTAVGPHDAAALIARQHSNSGTDSERLFDYVITHDRETVISAARSLMQYLDPTR